MLFILLLIAGSFVANNWVGWSITNSKLDTANYQLTKLSQANDRLTKQVSNLGNQNVTLQDELTTTQANLATTSQDLAQAKQRLALYEYPFPAISVTHAQQLFAGRISNGHHLVLWGYGIAVEYVDHAGIAHRFAPEKGHGFIVLQSGDLVQNIGLNGAADGGIVSDLDFQKGYCTVLVRHVPGLEPKGIDDQVPTCS